MNANRININLLPRPKRKIRQVPFILLLGILMIAAGGWYLLHEFQAISQEKLALEEQIKSARSQKEQLQKELAQANQQVSSKTDVSAYVKLPQLIKNASVSTDFLLDRLAELLPADSIINSLEYKQPDQVKVSGKFSTVEEAVSFIQAVEKSNYFSMAKIGSVSVNKDQKNIVESVIGQKVAPFYMISFELVIKKNQLVSAKAAAPMPQTSKPTNAQPATQKQ